MVTTMNVSTPSVTGNQDGNKGPSFVLESVDPVFRYGKRAKFTTRVSAALIHELMASGKIRVDYDQQRGEKIGFAPDGTETRTPMLDSKRVDEIADKILNDSLYGGSLTWNLRPDEVAASYDEYNRRLYITGGVPTRPDSNHRHEGIFKAVDRAKQLGLSFDADGYEFPLVIEQLDIFGEQGLFHEYNQLGKPANPSRDRVVHQTHLPNRMVTRVIERDGSPIRKENVELVTNNLSRRSTKVATFNTLAKGIEMGFPYLDEGNFDQIAGFLDEFVVELAKARPEIGYLPISDRMQVRDTSVGDSGLIIQTYFRLAGTLWNTQDDAWHERVGVWGKPYCFKDESGAVVYEGDLMNRKNPLWHQTVLIQTKNGKYSVSNRRESREFAYHRLSAISSL